MPNKIYLNISQMVRWNFATKNLVYAFDIYMLLIYILIQLVKNRYYHEFEPPEICIYLIQEFCHTANIRFLTSCT